MTVSTTTNALKEWATVVRALENGDQTVILRKGGIMEVASGFRVESEKFWLFPTFEHQEESHIKPQYHHYLEEVKKNPPQDGSNVISSYAQVVNQTDLDSSEKIKSLSPFHIWSDAYIKERMEWNPDKSMNALFLRVFKVKEPFSIPILSEYKGCKSWIDVKPAFDESASPVLSEKEFNESLEEFRRIVS